MSIATELETRIREQGVRVEERLELLRLLSENGGEERILEQIEALAERIRQLSRTVQGVLR